MANEFKSFSNTEKAQMAVDLMSSLILSHQGMLGSEQHRPGPDVDRSDELMAEHRLENLFTGVVT